MIHCTHKTRPYISGLVGELCIEHEPMFEPNNIPSICQDDSIVYSAFMCDEIEAFTRAFCSQSHKMTVPEWRGVILHGQIGFQIYAMVGCLRLIAEHHGKVSAYLPEEYSTLAQYYTDFFGKFDIDLVVMGHETHQVQPIAVKDKPLFAPTENGVLLETDFRKPILQQWELDDTHASSKLHWCGLPLFTTPSIIPALATLLGHYKPKTIFDIGANKFGITSLLANLTHCIQASVIAITTPDAGNDSPWWDRLQLEPWATYTKRACWNPSTNIFSPDDYANNNGPIMVFINRHRRGDLQAIVDGVRLAYNNGVFVFHADRHMDTPGFLADLVKQSGIRRVCFSYSPPSGTWIEQGVLEFHND